MTDVPRADGDGGDRSADSDRPGDEPEELPAADDPYWDEIAGQVTSLLHELRAGHRRERLRGAAYAGYVAVLLAMVYVAPYLGVAVTSPARGTGSAGAAAVPLAAATVVLLLLVAAVRDAAWRGPALLDLAAASWLLPAPIARGRLLRPRLRLVMVSGAALGGLAGAVVGVLLRLLTGGSVAGCAVGGAATGLFAGLLATAAAGLAEGASGWAQRWLDAAGAWLWLVPAVPAVVVTAWAVDPAGAGGSLGRAIAPLVLWSGPWGWAAQPLAAAVATGGPGVAGWPVASVAALVIGVVAAWWADRRIDRVPARTLRARAVTVSAVSASVWTLQPRRARALIRGAQGWAPRACWRLPVPRQRWLILPWRDATALLRASSRLLWGLLWLVAAVVLVRAGAAHPVGTGPQLGTTLAQHLALSVPGLVALYVAAAQLVEPARLDADDPRAARGLPLEPSTLARWHLVVPGAVLLGGLAVIGLGLAAAGSAGLIAAGPGAVAGLPAGITECALAVPALLGAALVSAYRGDVPVGVLVGASTPMGDSGPSQLLLWYLRGPLVALGLLAPVAVGRGIWLDAIVAASAMVSWSGSRARALFGG
ncbi:MAG TPA: hypothetical protein VFP72_13640 [Kineosporiaceae bacterium]|nr:hypothetical protein [Kineosporiaceae bacterium]